MKLLARVWDIDGGKMSAGIDLELFMGGEGCELEFQEESLPLKDFLFFRKEYSDWMLSTGKKDKNGIEIFEGDILKKAYGSSVPLCTVAWSEERLMFIQRDGYNEPLHELNMAYIEVVGNIYQSPSPTQTDK
jgi:hypothetical protein